MTARVARLPKTLWQMPRRFLLLGGEARYPRLDALLDIGARATADRYRPLGR